MGPGTAPYRVVLILLQKCGQEKWREGAPVSLGESLQNGPVTLLTRTALLLVQPSAFHVRRGLRQYCMIVGLSYQGSTK